jgi:endonuclease/exonuclease/phosphatase family metal-dependent hydrolase
MAPTLLTRQRKVLDGEIREPTLLAMALTISGLAALLGICVVGIAFLPPLGHIGWAFAALSAILVSLLVGFFRKSKPDAAPPTSRQRWFRRVLASARIVFIAVLMCWLGLIVWLWVGPGGPAPPAKADPDWIRVVTWNIHCGQDKGPPWVQFDWPARKHALQAAIDQAKPDILSVQEATPDQVAFLEEALPGHHRVGVGRDDGKSGGEHSAIYFSRDRFEERGGNTFWLEEPTDQPRAGSGLVLGLNVKRICTWARLRDRVSGRTLRVYNTHMYLSLGTSPAQRVTAAKIILDHIAAGDPQDAILLTADFNASPSRPARRLFIDAGLANAAELMGKTADTPTIHVYGIGLSWVDGILVDASIDGILVDQHWRVHDHLILNVKPHNIFPSDHFALLADLALSK